MKRYRFFQCGLLCLMLSSLGLMGQKITYPIHGSVFQQSANGNATINIAIEDFDGMFSTTPFYQIINVKTNTIYTGGVLSNPKIVAGKKLYAFNINYVPKGWYYLRYYHAVPSIVIKRKFLSPYTTYSLTKMHEIEFGVGDNYFIAGQSNASGYNESLYDNVITHSTDDKAYPSDNSNTQVDNSMTRTFIDDTDKWQYITKGLPSSNIGFQQLTKDDRQIYPNGFGSWCWAPLGDEMANLDNTPTLFFNNAKPNTTLLADWVGYPNQNDKSDKNTLIGKFYQTLGFYGNILGVKAVLWHQGERDTQIIAGQDGWTTDPTRIENNYQNYLKLLIEGSRSSQLTGLSNISWFVSKVSYNPGVINNSTSPNYANYAQNFLKTSLTCYDKYFSSKMYNYQTPPVGLTKVFTGVHSDFIDNDNTDGHIELYSDGSVNFNNSKTDCYRANQAKIHFTGANNGVSNSLGMLGHAWYTAIKANYANATPIQATDLLTIKSVTTNLTSYTIEINPPANAATYYWCLNGNGINNPTATTTTASTNINMSEVDRLICYVKDAQGRFYATQPFTPKCRNCLIAKLLTISPNSINLLAAGETKPITVTGTIDWDVLTVPSWITLTWNDETQNLEITATANTTGSIRTSTISFVEYGTTSQVATLTISQSAANNCQTNLSSLSPINPQSEWTGFGSLQSNKSIDANTLRVNNYTTSNGLGTHANSRLVYQLNGQYNTFTGSVGRDDEVDGCSCGNMKIQFSIKADGVTLFTSNLLGVNDAKQDFSVNVAGKNQLELIVNDGGDNNWGDHADWLDAILFCSGTVCTTPPAPQSVASSPSSITSGGSSTLSAQCSQGTVTWSTGAIGTSTVVSPSTSSTYTVKCVNNGCVSSTVSIGVTVSLNTCSLTDGLVMGTWTATNSPLVARFFNGSFWLTQRTGTNPDAFVVRASQMLQRSDVSLNNGNYANMVTCFSFPYSGYGGLLAPTSGEFTTPTGYLLDSYPDGTPYYQASTSSATLTSGACYVIKSVQTNNAMQLMSDNTVLQQSPNGQNTQIWKAESVGSQWKFTNPTSSKALYASAVGDGAWIYAGNFVSNNNNYIWTATPSGNNFRISLPSSNTWDMEGAGGGSHLQLWGTTAESFVNYRLWNFQSTTCPAAGTGSCIDKYAAADWVSWTQGCCGNSPQIGKNMSGGVMSINGTNYSYGIGTHAHSEIIYNLGNHSYDNFKASVGREHSVASCNCGTQTMVFKVYNNSTGALLAGPITKGNYQSATDMVVPITGVTSLKLVVDDGGDNNWGDQANWANARFTCPNSNLRQMLVDEDSISNEAEFFTISPNPNTGKFEVKVTLNENEKIEFALTDQQGRMWKTFEYNGSKGIGHFELDVHHAPSGLYILKANGQTKHGNKTVLIER